MSCHVYAAAVNSEHPRVQLNSCIFCSTSYMADVRPGSIKVPSFSNQPYVQSGSADQVFGLWFESCTQSERSVTNQMYWMGNKGQMGQSPEGEDGWPVCFQGSWHWRFPGRISTTMLSWPRWMVCICSSCLEPVSPSDLKVITWVDLYPAMDGWMNG